MRSASIIKKLLGLKDIRIKDFQLFDDEVVISVTPYKHSSNRCPHCNRKSRYYDSGRGKRRWRCLDWAGTKVFVEAEAYRVKCKEHGVVVAHTPWARLGSWYTYRFEDQVAWLARGTSKQTVSQLMRISWPSVGAIISRVYQDKKDVDTCRFDGLVRIGIDETSYKKGHKYLTVVVNHDTGNVIWLHVGYGKEILTRFFEELTPNQRASILYVSADGAKWIETTTLECCENASVCLDPFHTVSWATTALDEVRKGLWKEIRAGEVDTKYPVGRPMAGEPKREKRTPAKANKQVRWTILKNPENLNPDQQNCLEMTVRSNPTLYRAYLLKEDLRSILKMSVENAEACLEQWIYRAQRSRIPAFVELQRKIRRNKEKILAAIRFKLSNARIEATNNKIKLIVRMAYGFRNTDNLMSLIMLKCSGVEITLPGRC